MGSSSPGSSQNDGLGDGPITNFDDDVALLRKMVAYDVAERSTVQNCLEEMQPITIGLKAMKQFLKEHDEDGVKKLQDEARKLRAVPDPDLEQKLKSAEESSKAFEAAAKKEEAARKEAEAASKEAEAARQEAESALEQERVSRKAAEGVFEKDLEREREARKSAEGALEKFETDLERERCSVKSVKESELQETVSRQAAEKMLQQEKNKPAKLEKELEEPKKPKSVKRPAEPEQLSDAKRPKQEVASLTPKRMWGELAKAWITPQTCVDALREHKDCVSDKDAFYRNEQFVMNYTKAVIGSAKRTNSVEEIHLLLREGWAHLPKSFPELKKDYIAAGYCSFRQALKQAARKFDTPAASAEEKAMLQDICKVKPEFRADSVHWFSKTSEKSVEAATDARQTPEKPPTVPAAEEEVSVNNPATSTTSNVASEVPQSDTTVATADSEKAEKISEEKDALVGEKNADKKMEDTEMTVAEAEEVSEAPRDSVSDLEEVVVPPKQKDQEMKDVEEKEPDNSKTEAGKEMEVKKEAEKPKKDDAEPEGFMSAESDGESAEKKQEVKKPAEAEKIDAEKPAEAEKVDAEKPAEAEKVDSGEDKVDPAMFATMKSKEIKTWCKNHGVSTAHINERDELVKAAREAVESNKFKKIEGAAEGGEKVNDSEAATDTAPEASAGSASASAKNQSTSSGQQQPKAKAKSKPAAGKPHLSGSQEARQVQAKKICGLPPTRWQQILDTKLKLQGDRQNEKACVAEVEKRVKILMAIFHPDKKTTHGLSEEESQKVSTHIQQAKQEAYKSLVAKPLPPQNVRGEYNQNRTSIKLSWTSEPSDDRDYVIASLNSRTNQWTDLFKLEDQKAGDLHCSVDIDTRSFDFSWHKDARGLPHRVIGVCARIKKMEIRCDFQKVDMNNPNPYVQPQVHQHHHPQQHVRPQHFQHPQPHFSQPRPNYGAAYGGGYTAHQPPPHQQPPLGFSSRIPGQVAPPHPHPHQQARPMAPQVNPHQFQGHQQPSHVDNATTRRVQHAAAQAQQQAQKAKVEAERKKQLEQARVQEAKRRRENEIAERKQRELERKQRKEKEAKEREEKERRERRERNERDEVRRRAEVREREELARVRQRRAGRERHGDSGRGSGGLSSGVQQQEYPGPMPARDVRIPAVRPSHRNLEAKEPLDFKLNTWGSKRRMRVRLTWRHPKGPDGHEMGQVYVIMVCADQSNWNEVGTVAGTRCDIKQEEFDEVFRKAQGSSDVDRISVAVYARSDNGTASPVEESFYIRKFFNGEGSGPIPKDEE